MTKSLRAREESKLLHLKQNKLGIFCFSPDFLSNNNVCESESTSEKKISLFLATS